jgi:hypothetical protein
MTRTERSHSLRALIKDRSEARNGMDNSVPKGGAGGHNWGTLDSELEYQNAAIADEAAEFDDEGGGKRSLADVQLRPRFDDMFRSLQSSTKEVSCCAPYEQRH